LLGGHLGHLLATNHLQLETASAFVSALYVVVVSAPFSDDEEEVMAWVCEVDDTELLGITPLPNGMDLIILERKHTKQNLLEACLEQQESIRKAFAS
jgi:hypothetical protein